MQRDPAAVRPADRQVRKNLLGLGGIAVTFVVVCHIWFGYTSGALDVLLVLLGFVYGARMLRTLDGTEPAPLRTEAAWLVRRLVPVLIVVLAACAALTVVIQPQTRWEAFAEQTLASLGFFQNWGLAGTASSYLRANEAAAALQNLWALSMLGQVFVVLLALAGVIRATALRSGTDRARNIFVGVAGLALVASLACALLVHSTDRSFAYYSTVTRAWEVLAGVLVAAVVARINWPRWLRAVASVAGLAAILACGALIDGSAQSPGPWALLPVGATLLVIVSAAQDSRLPLTNRVLGSAPLAGLGTMAFSLYLWHWPVLIFWLAHTNNDAVDWVDAGAVIAVSASAAFVTSRVVEAPWCGAHVQRRELVGALSGATVTLLAVVLVAGSVAWQGYVDATRDNGADLLALPAHDYPGAQALIDNLSVASLPMRPSALEAPEDLPPTTIDECVTDFASVEVISCVYGDPKGDHTIALAGGSHSEHWLTALHEIGRQRGFRVTTYLKMGCPLTTKEVPIVAGALEPYLECRTWSDHAMTQMIADRPDHVFFTTTRPVLNGPGDYVPDYYVGIWEELSANGISILGMRDTPWMVGEGMFYGPVDCLASNNDVDDCALPRHEALAERNPTLDYLVDYPLMHALDLSDAVCRSDVCRPVEGNVLIYHDAHHLSATYVRTLADELTRQLADTVYWWDALP